MDDTTNLRELPELLSALRDLVAETLRSCVEMDGELSAHVGYEVARRFCEQWGGDSCYIPKADSLQRYSRDLQIWAKFTGHNHAALAREFRVSKVWVYAIVKRMRAVEVERRQGKLFAAEQQAA